MGSERPKYLVSVYLQIYHRISLSYEWTCVHTLNSCFHKWHIMRGASLTHIMIGHGFPIQIKSKMGQKSSFDKLPFKDQDQTFVPNPNSNTNLLVPRPWSRLELKGPFTYLGNFRVNWTAYSLLIGNSLSFQGQLWPEKKPIFRSEFERKGMVPLYRHYLMFFSPCCGSK